MADLILRCRLAKRRPATDNSRMSTTADLQSVALCRLEDIPDPGSLGLTHAGESLFVVRQGADAQVFVNRCPHRGIPLEWVANQFLDSSGRLIQCATHGALFLPDTGECVSGPCAGESLIRRESRIRDGLVWLAPTLHTDTGN